MAKEIAVYVVSFNTWTKDGLAQVGMTSFTTKKAAENEAKIFRANGHKNVKVTKTTLAF